MADIFKQSRDPVCAEAQSEYTEMVSVYLSFTETIVSVRKLPPYIIQQHVGNNTKDTAIQNSEFKK